MAVPEYHRFFIPFLKLMSDGKEHTSKEAYIYCANYYNLTEEDKAETLSSGMIKYIGRVGWAKTYLSKAGLVEAVKKGMYKLTAEGLKVAQTDADMVDLNYLCKYDSFKKFLGKDENYKVAGKSTQISNSPVITEAENSPQEMMDSAYEKIKSSLADELMAEVMQMNPYKFEKLVVNLLGKMGYGDFQETTKKSGDEGIDGMVAADRLGFDVIYTQAKRWQPDSTVGAPEVQSFLGALAGQGATKGLFITTAKFSKKAKEFVQKNLNAKIVLIDGEQLCNFMIEYNIGVSVEKVFEVKRLDTDYFNDEF